MENNTDKIFQKLVLLAITLGTDESELRLKAMAKILSSYDTERILMAIDEIALKNIFFPRPVEIIQLVEGSPDKDDANLLAGRIIEAISRFGWPNESEARKYVGEEAWDAILMAGGWVTICTNENCNVESLRAQLRDLAKVSMKKPSLEKKEALRLEKRQDLKPVNYNEFLELN